MSERLKRFAEKVEPGFDALLQRVVALQRTAVVVTLSLLATHAIAWAFGRAHWPF